ncbi:MAG: hypothetical protein QOE90_3413 [Thermoplasmata archaeon]|jgi:hypothetical protein|nr:hypothetical protein [Thermoplasmata archaeon]
MILPRPIHRADIGRSERAARVNSNLRIIASVLVLLVFASGVAAASPCPRCDPGSGDNWWSHVNVGATGNATGPVRHNLDSGAVENTGLGVAHRGDHKGFWAFMTICFDAWADKLSRMTHLNLALHGKASVYADSHVVDAKANVAGVDTTKLVRVNDTTWKAEATARGQLAAHGVVVPDVPAVVPTENLPQPSGDVCVQAKVTVGCA